jgi:radical SAM superfamily enzyme YgiQ (UPF0313 family)
MKKSILLIGPASDNEALWITGREGPEVKNNILPLGLATIAGLTPDEFHVDIWDELVHGFIDNHTIFERDYALVGITGFKAHLPRCSQLAGIFRERSIPVAIGGPGVSATPAEYSRDFDILFVGEAERTWPQFLSDWQKGSYKSEYRQIEKIPLDESPMPKWGSIAADVPKYALGTVQTTRGCPFDCEFCDVIYLFGRHPRQKPIQNVLEEVKVLERLGVQSIFFCDDEFNSRPRYTKDLLRALIQFNNSIASPLSFSTQTGMSVSNDEELLELMAKANFEMLFIGIETPNKESLKECNKGQNIRHDLVANIHKVFKYGIAIRAGIIVGFDHDDTDIFDIQYDFIQKAFLPSVAINMLKAPSGTRLWARLRKEGRVVIIPRTVRDNLGHPRSYTSIIPKRMTRVDLMKGYRKLLERVYNWESFSERIRGFVSVATRIPKNLGTTETEDKLSDSFSTLKVGPEGSKAINDIIMYSSKEGPFLLGRVKALIVQHAKYCESINKLLPQIDRQIELESLGKLNFEPDRRQIPLSTYFRKAYKEIFFDIHRRIYLNLKDKHQVPAALVEVFIDFLVRCGEEFSRLEDYHRSFLNEICDRTCAKFNGEAPEEFVAAVTDDIAIPDVKNLRLDDDILKSVEQKLINLASVK